MSQNEKKTGWVYEDSGYWERTYGFYLSKEGGLHSNALTEGNDGEQEFDDKMLNASVGKNVLDVGCGDGSFTIRIAEKGAKLVIGVDFSKMAISEAQKNLAKSEMNNVRFELAKADKLPFLEETFDLLISRRGPVTHKTESLSEAYRVLRKGGVLMEITIGERDKENIAQVFGRGQMLGSEKGSTLKDEMLSEAGFTPLEIKDYAAMEIFPTMHDLIVRLNNSPIIPDFDLAKDQTHLEEMEKSCKTPRGIETQSHRVAIIARR